MLWAPESVYRKSGIRCYPCRLLLRDPSNPVLQATNITMQVCLQLKNAQNFEGSGRPKCCIVLQWHAEAPTLSFARIALASVVSMVSFSSCNSASLLLNYFLLKLVKPLCPWGSKGNPNATTSMRRRSPTACDLAPPYRFFPLCGTHRWWQFMAPLQFLQKFYINRKTQWRLQIKYP